MRQKIKIQKEEIPETEEESFDEELDSLDLDE